MTARAAAKRTTRTVRPSKAVAAALKADAPTMQLPTITPTPVAPDVPTIDQLAAEAGPAVFRLLAHGNVEAAWRLLMTYTEEAERAYWSHLASPSAVR